MTNVTLAEIMAVGNGWPERIQLIHPKNILELGTGQGASGAKIMSALDADAVFTTINYADGHKFGEQLEPWKDDARLRRLDMDTLDPSTLRHVPDNVEVMFIDTTHEAWHALAELRLWQYKLVHGAVVIVDDLDHNDMVLFWNSLPYAKAVIGQSIVGQGTFIYDASVTYGGAFFYKPNRTTYAGNR